MRKTSKKSTNTGVKKAEKAYGMASGKTVITIDPNRLISWSPLKPYPGPQGSRIFPMEFQAYVASPTTDGAGVLQYNKQITAALFPQMVVEATRFKKARLRELMFVLQPKKGMNVDGSCAAYFNYASDSAVPPSLADVAKREGVKLGMVPFKKYTLRWRIQDNKDTEFAAASNATQFNTTNTHWLKIYGDGLPVSTQLWDLYAYAIIEFTEYFN